MKHFLLSVGLKLTPSDRDLVVVLFNSKRNKLKLNTVRVTSHSPANSFGSAHFVYSRQRSAVSNVTKRLLTPADAHQNKHRNVCSR